MHQCTNTGKDTNNCDGFVLLMRRKRALKEGIAGVDGKRWRWWEVVASGGEVEVIVRGGGCGSDRRGVDWVMLQRIMEKEMMEVMQCC